MVFEITPRQCSTLFLNEPEEIALPSVFGENRIEIFLLNVCDNRTKRDLRPIGTRLLD